MKATRIGFLAAARDALSAAARAVDAQRTHADTAYRLSELALEIALTEDTLVGWVASGAQAGAAPLNYEYPSILAILRDVRNAIAVNARVSADCALAEAERRLAALELEQIS